MNDHSAGMTDPQRLDCQNTEVRSACAPSPKLVGATRDERDAEHRHLLEVVAQVVHAGRDALLLRGGAIDVVLGRISAGTVDELVHRGAIDLGEGGLARVIVDEEEAVRLLVRSVRCVHRDIEALLDDGPLDGSLQIESPAHRRRGDEHLVEVVDGERPGEQLLVGGERAPVLPDAIDEAVVVEAEEEAVHVLVWPAGARGGVVRVLTEDEGAVRDHLHVAEADRGEVVAIDGPAVWLRRGRGPTEHDAADLVAPPEDGLTRRLREASHAVPPLAVLTRSVSGRGRGDR
jgi:hypothetical protein